MQDQVHQKRISYEKLLHLYVGGFTGSSHCWILHVVIFPTKLVHLFQNSHEKVIAVFVPGP
jgi:hypothetical protein